MAGSSPAAPVENTLSDRASESKPKSKTMALGTVSSFVYILKCADRQYSIVSTSDVADRERIHNAGPQARTVRRRILCRLEAG